MTLQTRKLLQIPDRREMAWQAGARVLLRARRDPDAPCVQRVLQMLLLMKEAEELRLQAHRGYSGNIQTLTRAFRGRLVEIERLGKRYRWSPALKGGYSLGLSSMFTWPNQDQDDKWENEAVSWLMTHVTTSGSSPSRILRFRTCGWCGAWFYALTDHQRYCSSGCRQKYHATSVEFRAKRADYMRERYRPAEKDREERAKTLVGRRRK